MQTQTREARRLQVSGAQENLVRATDVHRRERERALKASQTHPQKPPVTMGSRPHLQPSPETLTRDCVLRKSSYLNERARL